MKKKTPCMKPSQNGHLKNFADVFVHDRQHFFMNSNPGFTKMTTWMTISDNKTFQMQRLTVVKHSNLDTALKRCRKNASFSLTCAFNEFRFFGSPLVKLMTKELSLHVS